MINTYELKNIYMNNLLSSSGIPDRCNNDKRYYVWHVPLGRAKDTNIYNITLPWKTH